MASVTLGRIKGKSGLSMWKSWSISLQLILLLEDEKKTFSFSDRDRCATYKVLGDLVAPAKPGTKPLEELL